MPTNKESHDQVEFQAPTWMNSDFFTKVLHNCEKDETIKLIDFILPTDSMKDYHYSSVMFRANVTYHNSTAERHTISMIIKTMPEVECIKKEMLKESYIFETEIAMYNKVIPRFEAMLREIDDETVLGARCLYHSLDPVKVIVFEDLAPLGYSMPRDGQANLEEAKFVLEKLAKWHACSYKINQENPTILDGFSHDFMEMTQHDLGNVIGGGIKMFIEMLNTQPSLIKYKPYFEALQPTLIEKCHATYREYRESPHPDAHYVLCHGDFHCKNMMFKRSVDNNKLEDIMLLDFQLCYLGPMVNDIIYAFYMLVPKEIRLHHREELIHHYFRHFVETLDRLSFTGKAPTLFEFCQMLVRHSHLEIFLLTTFLPMWYAYELKTPDPKELIESADFRKRLYTTKGYLAELEECLPWYLEMGFLGSQVINQL